MYALMRVPHAGVLGQLASPMVLAPAAQAALALLEPALCATSSIRGYSSLTSTSQQLAGSSRAPRCGHDAPALTATSGRAPALFSPSRSHAHAGPPSVRVFSAPVRRFPPVVLSGELFWSRGAAGGSSMQAGACACICVAPLPWSTPPRPHLFELGLTYA